MRWAPFPDEAALLKLLAERPAKAMTDARDDGIEEPEPYAPPGALSGAPSRRFGRRSQIWGLVGVAFFHEMGSDPRMTAEEVRRRHDADAFPGRFAEPAR